VCRNLSALLESTLDFSNEALQAAEKGLSKLEKAIQTLAQLTPGQGESTYDVAAFNTRCHAAMNDDFNTPILIATMFDAVKAINGASAGNVILTADDISALTQTMETFMRDVLGLQAESSSSEGGSGSGDAMSALLDLIVDMRAKAKANKDWGTADQIRDVLADHGITIQDSKDGSSWTRG